MTKEEAIKVLEQIRQWTDYPKEALTMAIDALSVVGKFQQIEGKLVDWYETKGVDYCCGIKTEDAFEVPEGFYIKKK